MMAADTASSSGFDLGTLFGGRLAQAGRHGDILLAIGVVAILVVLILPLPVWLLDICLAFSITLSVLILLTALFAEKPLEFNAFPTVLLLATMVRLALNLASTRLILAHGHEGADAAGHVIEAFAGFVMGGSFVIGVIVFAILMIVNFIVITKGSGRIAEVSARFTLDAMPGKQMAIDADLSAGLIGEDEARTRRRALEDESSFFGAMDGAAKFVRGDAVAGLLITFINIVAGIIIGVGERSMGFLDAADAYARLTVGDGLVTQIPALIVSTAAGIIVTKAGISGKTEKALFGQLAGNPKVLGMAASLLTLLSLLPGIPLLPFLLLAGITGGLAWSSHRRSAAVPTDEQAKAVAESQPAAEEPISSALRMDEIRLELGYGLLTLVGGTGDGPRLTGQVKALRRQLAAELGFVMPSVRIQDNMQLPANAYVVHIKEIEAGRGEVRPAMLLAMDPRGEEIGLPGERTREPTFGLPALWIDPAHREEALFRGLTVVEPATVVTTHLTEVVKDNLNHLLSYAETRKLLDQLDQDQQKLIADVIPTQVSYASVQRVLQNLLSERISIRDLPSIVEGIAEACGYTRDAGQITEHVRARLARQISDMHTNEAGIIPLLTLAPEWEQAFADSLADGGADRQPAIAPSKLQQFVGALRSAYERQAQVGETPVLLTSPAIRPYVRSIVERFRPSSAVISQSEISPKARIKTVGRVG
jgi:flagellar biosynthesis protein FlhA